MALGYLAILYIVLLVATIGLQGLLYMGGEGLKDSRIVFIGNMVFAILLAYLSFTSLPTNFKGQRFLAVLLGMVAPLAMFLSLRDRRFLVLAKLLMSISLLGGSVQLFI